MTILSINFYRCCGEYILYCIRIIVILVKHQWSWVWVLCHTLDTHTHLWPLNLFPKDTPWDIWPPGCRSTNLELEDLSSRELPMVPVLCTQAERGRDWVLGGRVCWWCLCLWIWWWDKIETKARTLMHGPCAVFAKKKMARKKGQHRYLTANCIRRD